MIVGPDNLAAVWSEVDGDGEFDLRHDDERGHAPGTMSSEAETLLATQWKNLWNGDLGIADQIIAENLLVPGAAPEAAGREVSFTGSDILRIASGRLAEHWANADSLPATR